MSFSSPVQPSSSTEPITLPSSEEREERGFSPSPRSSSQQNPSGLSLSERRSEVGLRGTPIDILEHNSDFLGLWFSTDKDWINEQVNDLASQQPSLKLTEESAQTNFLSQVIQIMNASPRAQQSQLHSREEWRELFDATKDPVIEEWGKVENFTQQFTLKNLRQLCQSAQQSQIKTLSLGIQTAHKNGNETQLQHFRKTLVTLLSQSSLSQEKLHQLPALVWEKIEKGTLSRTEPEQLYHEISQLHNFSQALTAEDLLVLAAKDEKIQESLTTLARGIQAHEKSIQQSNARSQQEKTQAQASIQRFQSAAQTLLQPKSLPEARQKELPTLVWEKIQQGDLHQQDPIDLYTELRRHEDAPGTWTSQDLGQLIQRAKEIQESLTTLARGIQAHEKSIQQSDSRNQQEKAQAQASIQRFRSAAQTLLQNSTFLKAHLQELPDGLRKKLEREIR